MNFMNRSPQVGNARRKKSNHREKPESPTNEKKISIVAEDFNNRKHIMKLARLMKERTANRSMMQSQDQTERSAIKQLAQGTKVK